jgi:hypothetical protein
MFGLLIDIALQYCITIIICVNPTTANNTVYIAYKIQMHKQPLIKLQRKYFLKDALN